MIRRATPALAAAVLVALAGCGSDSSGGDGDCPPADGVDERVTSFDEAPPMCIDEDKTYTATMTTDAGEVEIELDAKQAPKTVNNFVVLSRYKFYDGTSFHRAIKGFMIQGGSPTGEGSGGPGYQFEDELPQRGEYEVGSIAMANSGPDTNGSQFFIVTGEAGTQLPPSYSLFGKVTDGMDAVGAIEADGSDGDPAPPVKVHTIESVTISEE